MQPPAKVEPRALPAEAAPMAPPPHLQKLIAPQVTGALPFAACKGTLRVVELLGGFGIFCKGAAQLTDQDLALMGQLTTVLPTLMG